MSKSMIANVLEIKGVRKLSDDEVQTTSGGNVTIEYTYHYGPNGNISQEIDGHMWDE